MGDNKSSSTNTDVSATAAKLASIAMVLAVIFFFLLVILALVFYVYTHYLRIGRSMTRRRAAHTHFIFAAGDASIPSHGLNPSILVSLPISIYRLNDFKERLECAVCLSELTDGEKARLLPNCNHGFHLECIDMWFHSHSTCPLCRRPVGGEEDLQLSASEDMDIEWSGLQGEGMLAISTPDRSTEMFQSSLSLTSSRSQVEEIKSPVECRSPTRLNRESLKRILSREKMIDGTCCSSPGDGDIDQIFVGHGEGSSAFPKASNMSTL